MQYKSSVCSNQYTYQLYTCIKSLIIYLRTIINTFLSIETMFYVIIYLSYFDFFFRRHMKSSRIEYKKKKKKKITIGL